MNTWLANGEFFCLRSAAARRKIEILRDIVAIYRQYGFKTEILAASIRHPIHVIEAAKAGTDIATMPYKVFNQLFNHPLTEKGQERFLKDWEQVAELVR